MSAFAFGRGRRDLGWARRGASQAILGLLVAAVAGAVTLFAHSHRAVNVVALVVVLLGTAWFASTRRVTLALAALMLYLGLLDGYLKLATGSTSVTLVRDALVFSLALGVLLRASLAGRPLAVPPLGGWVVFFSVCVLVQLANPHDGSLYHSLGGVRQHLEFVPLFFLTYSFVRTREALRWFVILLVAIGAINGAVDVIQYNETTQQLAAWGPGYSQRILGTQGFAHAGREFYTANGSTVPRPFGLGSDAGDGGLMAAFALGGILTLALLHVGRRRLLLASVAGALAVAGVITAQGRAVIVCAFVVVLAYALLTATSRRATVTLIAVAVLTGATFGIYEVVAGSSNGPALRTSNLSFGNLLSTTAKNRGSSLAQIPSYLVDHPLGAGLGVAGPALSVKGGGENAGVLNAENEVNFAIIETGIPGLIGVVGFTLLLVILGLRRCKREPDPETRMLLAAVIAPIASMLVVYSVNALSPTTPGGPYLWAVGGIVAYWLVARPRELASVAPPAMPEREPTSLVPAGA